MDRQVLDLLRRAKERLLLGVSARAGVDVVAQARLQLLYVLNELRLVREVRVSLCIMVLVQSPMLKLPALRTRDVDSSLLVAPEGVLRRALEVRVLLRIHRLDRALLEDLVRGGGGGGFGSNWRHWRDV